MRQPTNCLTRDIRDYGVVEFSGVDRSRRVFFGDIPLGRKCQPPGPKCADEAHAEGAPNMYEDRYKGVRKTYVDRVCRTCNRRIMVV